MTLPFFPEELKALAQWMVSGSGDPSSLTYKRPIDPKSGKWGSIIDPRTWGTYEEAMASPYPLKGFVFTRDDPYAVIDLDTYKAQTDAIRDGHAAIKQAAETYSELSQSGLGTHIIGRGYLPEGVHKDAACLEMYSHARFMICTGNVGADGMVKPVNDIQPLLDHLYSLLKDRTDPGVVNWRDLGDGEESCYTDTEIVEKAMAAENSDKFLRLCNGDLTMHGGDWSRADEALIQFYCYYTPDNNQVARLFRYSKLAERDKVHRPDYIPRTILYAREKIAKDTPPPIDVSAIAERARQVRVDQHAHAMQDAGVACLVRAESAIVAEDAGPYTPCLDTSGFPPGLIGEVAQYVLAASSRPVPEIALATAIAIVCGIAGRQYNCSTPSTGLNQYILLLAKTGTGKEAAQTCIDKLFNEVQKTVPAATRFLGPARFASGQALVKHFQTQICFLSVLGEFGDKIALMAHPNSNAADKMLMADMKDLYHKSGWGQQLRQTVHSDKEKNTALVHAPTLTILAETAPEPFFNALDDRLIEGGFLPRFLTIEYQGDRPERNIGALPAPPAALVKKVADLCSAALQMEQNNTCHLVQADAPATVVLDQFDRMVDNKMRGAPEVHRQLWNRAHLKALRLAAAVAVGVNPYNPIVTAAEARWAVAMVEKDVAVFSDKFKSGDVGQGDSKLRADITAVIQNYFGGGVKVSSGCDQDVYINRGCITRRYLLQRTANRAAFKNHKLGATRALNDTLAEMVKIGELVEIDKKSAHQWFNSSAQVYALGDHWNK